MNRDEQRTRKEAGSIKKKQVAGKQFCYYYPIDQVSGGSWFGFNDFGLTLALLNRYHEYDNTDADANVNKRSRGLIIPSLLECKNIKRVDKKIKSLLIDEFNTFDLVAIDHTEIVRFSWNGKKLNYFQSDIKQPFFLTSSSENTDAIVNHRSKLFSEFIESHKQQKLSAKKVICDFHLRQDKQNTSSSVYMSRPRAHTKSISHLIVTNKVLLKD